MGCCSEWLQGHWKHSENSRKKLKFSLKNCKIGRQGRGKLSQTAQQKSPTAWKRLDISIKRTLKIGHRLCWFCAMQQRKEPVTSFMSQALGAPEETRTPDLLIRSDVIALLFVPLYRQILALTAFYYVHILQVLRKTSAFADHVMGFDVQKTCKNVHLLTKITQDSSMYWIYGIGVRTQNHRRPFK